MPDICSKEKRSGIMSSIRGKDTRPEIFLRKALWRRGLRYRLHCKLPGSPDIVFVSARIALFIDGCFWHKCPRCGTWPSTNRRYWIPKLKDNVRRDKRVNEQLRRAGWKVVRIWEHEIRRDPSKPARRVSDLARTRKKCLS